MDEASSSGTVTQQQQADVENAVASLYEAFGGATNKERSLMLNLHRDDHEEYVTRGLRQLSAGYHVLDASRAWLCYWILHSLALLGRPVDDDLYDRTVEFLERCQDPNGGYAGGPGQMCRKKILEFLLRMKDPCGGFRVHDGGEMDMRGSFTAVAVAHLLDIMVPELQENVGEHVRSCQTYEGGIGAEPGAEAHGGYTFCGLAALALTDQLHMINLPNLVNWVAFRQGRVEGGFQGRTNKLVDGCYSFWQGGCFQLLQQHMPHLLAQQTTIVAAPHTSPDEGKASSIHGSVKTTVPVESAAAEAENPNNPLDDVQGDEHKLGHEHGSCGDESMDDKDEAQDQLSQATSPTPSSQIKSMKKTEDDTKDIPAKKWNSDEDEVEDWCSGSEGNHNAAEELFPMVQTGFQRVPLHTKIEEVVELADDGQGAPRGNFGSSSNTTGYTLDLGSSWDEDTLYGPIYNSQALQAYVLICCQDLDGGLRDKPGKDCDYYHTCYCLSGLSGAQYSTAHRLGAPPPPSGVLGPYSNLLEATHAVCNVRLDRYHEAQRYFKQWKL